MCLLASGSDILCILMMSLTKSFLFFLAPPTSLPAPTSGFDWTVILD